MTRSVLLGLLVLLVCNGPSRSDWISASDAKTGFHSVFIEDEAWRAEFRCSERENLTLFFTVPTEPTGHSELDPHEKTLHISVTLDDNLNEAYGSFAALRQVGTKAATFEAISGIVELLLTDASKSKTSMSISVSMKEKIFRMRSFNMRGAAEQLEKLIAECEIP